MRKRDRSVVGRQCSDLLFALILISLLTFALPDDTHAQGRTDVVTLANGDRITREIVRVERGRLEF